MQIDAFSLLRKQQFSCSEGTNTFPWFFFVKALRHDYLLLLLFFFKWKSVPVADGKLHADSTEIVYTNIESDEYKILMLKAEQENLMVQEFLLLMFCLAAPFLF